MLKNKLILLIKICVLYCSFFSLTFAITDNTPIPKDAIPFDKTPPAILKHFKRDMQERIEIGEYAKKQKELLEKISQYIEKYPFITLYTGGQGKHLIGLQITYENEKLATNEQKKILKEYRALVKEFHETRVLSASSFEYSMAWKILENSNEKNKETLKYNVVSRYPEYKDYHIYAVALFCFLIERSWVKEIEDFIMNEMRENKKTSNDS